MSATDAEVAPLVAKLQHVGDRGPRVRSYAHRGHVVDVLTTGVGMVATAAWCARTLMTRDYDLAFDLGLCGSFDRDLAPPSVVHVLSDRLPELGAEDGEAFLAAHELGLVGENEFPLREGVFVNTAPPDNAALRALRSVNGITVNTVHGDDRTIATLRERLAPRDASARSGGAADMPRVETMEGAAFMYACLVHGLPFAQVRAVSNFVERRNREAWRIPEAVAALNASAQELLDHI